MGKAFQIQWAQEPVTRTFTLGEFLDAIEANGIQQTVYTLMQPDTTSGDFKPVIEYEDESKGIKKPFSRPITSACAMGMAMLNLGVGLNSDLETQLDKFRLSAGNIVEHIVHLNDDSRWSFQRIAQHYRKYFKDQLDERINVKTTDRVIVLEDDTPTA